MTEKPGNYEISEGHVASCFLLDEDCPAEIAPPVGRDTEVFKTRPME